MKSLNLFFIPFIVMLVLNGCNKESIEQKSSDKQIEKKEALTETKKTETNNASSNSSNIKLYKLEKVDKINEKKAAPNFFWTENGKSTSLSELKGNVVLLNLWATWCGPCIREMPDLSKISDELSGKNFKMIGLNVFQQDGSKKVEDFLKTNPVSYTIIDGNQEIVDALGEANGSNIEAVPTTFIIDKNGKIVETIIGGRDKETFLKSINKYIN